MPMESSPESMRGALAAIFVPVTSAAIAVSSLSRAFCERVPLSALAGYVDYVDLGTFRGISDLGRDFLPAIVDFASPTETKRVSWKKLAIDNGFVDFGSRDPENDMTGRDLI